MPLHGLEVVCRMLSFGELIELTSIETVSDKHFVENIVSWNLEGRKRTPMEGQVLPITIESLRTLSKPAVGQLYRAWYIACGVSIAGPLDKPSTAGRPSQELLLTMEPRSESHQS
jgi:hypothetical protein